MSRQINNPADANPAWLMLVPTQMELDLLRQCWRSEFPCRVEVCGFGPIASAANTARMIARHHPRRIMLLGIAGVYRDEIGIGEAAAFDEVGCYGIGVGEGDRFRSAQSFGWQHWDGSDDSPAIGDRIELAKSTALDGLPETPRLLLTVTSVSERSVDVTHRLKHFPTAVAEDMEGFGVAVACQLANLPLRIVRGISNRAGDRNKSNWQIPAAIQSAAKLAEQILEK